MYVTSANLALAAGRGRFADAGRYLGHARRLAADGLYPQLGRINALVGTHLATLTGDPAFETYPPRPRGADVDDPGPSLLRAPLPGRLPRQPG